MEKFIKQTIACALLLAALPSLLPAQKNIYVARSVTPKKTAIVPCTERIEYVKAVSPDDFAKAVFHATGGKTTTLPLAGVRAMGLREGELGSASVMPASFLPDVDYDIAFSDADKELARVAEPAETDKAEKAYGDFVEHSVWDKRLTIDYGGGEARVAGGAEGVAVSVTGNHVVVNSSVPGLRICLRGASGDGSFKLYATNKTQLELGGLTLHNPRGAAVNSQSKKRLFIVLADGTVNTLSDGETYGKVAGEDQRGCVFSEGKMCISGAGQLYVNGNKKNGIASDDYIHLISGFVKVCTSAVKGAGVKAKDNFIMGGGALQVYATGLAAKAVKSDSLLCVRGGKLTAVTTGDGLWDEAEQDYSTACCVKSDYAMSLTGGELRLLSTGLGGKGIRAGTEAKKGHELTIDGAEIYVATAGDLMPAGATEETAVKSSPKGIKGSYDICIKSGSVYVRCSGGYGGEGIESKQDLNILGGKVRCYCYDDGVNAVNSTVDGGDIFVCSTENDGYDCNGGLFINGGTLFAIGAPEPQAGIDNDGKTFVINGGLVVSAGGYSSTPWASKSTQPSVLVQLKKAVPYIALTDGGGKDILVVKTPETYNPLVLLLTSPKLEVGKAYRILSFGRLLGGEEVGGVVENAAYASPVTEFEFTINEMLTTLGGRK